MRCEVYEDRMAAYLLGALDASERAEMDEHVDRCGECGAALREDGDLIVHMAYAAPQVEVPARVKQKLMARIPDPRPSPADALLRWLGGLAGAGQRVVAGPAGAVAGAMVIVLFLVGAWFNIRLNEIADEKAALESQIETMADGEAERARLVNDLRELAFWTTAPDASVQPPLAERGVGRRGPGLDRSPNVGDGHTARREGHARSARRQGVQGVGRERRRVSRRRHLRRKRGRMGLQARRVGRSRSPTSRTS